MDYFHADISRRIWDTKYRWREQERLWLVGWTCLAVLGITGWAQLEFRGMAWNANAVIVCKIAIYVAIVAISFLHDFWLARKPAWPCAISSASSTDRLLDERRSLPICAEPADLPDPDLQIRYKVTNTLICWISHRVLGDLRTSLLDYLCAD